MPLMLMQPWCPRQLFPQSLPLPHIRLRMRRRVRPLCWPCSLARQYACRSQPPTLMLLKGLCSAA